MKSELAATPATATVTAVASVPFAQPAPRPDTPETGALPQGPVARRSVPRVLAKGDHRWQLQPSAAYLRALQEAEQAVLQAAFRNRVLNHTLRLAA